MVAPPSAAAREERASPKRAYEVRPTVGGDDLPVNPPRALAPRRDATPAPAAPAAPPEGAGVTVRKPTRALPMQALQGVPRDTRAAAPAPAAPTPARAKSGALQLQAETARGLLCGSVVDDQGRAVAGAQVVLADLGLSVSTDRGGRFCMTAPAGMRTVSVMAVGFQQLRRTVKVDVQTPELALALKPVTVLSQPLAIGVQPEVRPAPGPAMNSLSPSAEAPAPAPVEESMASQAADEAQRPGDVLAPARHGEGGGGGGAAAHARGHPHALRGALRRRGVAVGAGVAQRARGTPARSRVRRRIAEARYRAWVIGPDYRRAIAAEDALTAYIARASTGRARNQAAEWLDRVKR